MQVGDNEVMWEHILERLSAIEERLDKLEKLEPKKSTDKKSAKAVWDAYSDAYQKRYGVEPVCNAKVMAQAKALASRVGQNDAVELMAFYLAQRDPFYLHAYHPLGACLKDAEGLITRSKTGHKITQQQAKQIEKSESAAIAGANYLARKQHGRES